MVCSAAREGQPQHPDPTNAGGNQLRGIEVIPTTQIAAGVDALLDTNKFGYAVVREALTFRTGTLDNDFVSNIVRFIYKERLTLAIERPSAVLKVKQGIQVVHDGDVFADGETAEVSEVVAGQWVREGWFVEVTSAPTK